MKRRNKLYGALITLTSLVILIFSLRSKDLTIHIVAESGQLELDMKIEFDNKIIFNDNIKSGAYFGKKIKIENVGIGFHKIRINSKKGRCSYQTIEFFLFNKTTIINYFEEKDKPGEFTVWRKFGKFLPD